MLSIQGFLEGGNNMQIFAGYSGLKIQKCATVYAASAIAYRRSFHTARKELAITQYLF